MDSIKFNQTLHCQGGRFVTMLQPKTTCQLFEAAANLELDYFINQLEEDMTIADFEKRLSIKDLTDKGVAFYFDNCCIFTIKQLEPEESVHCIPVVERYYLNSDLTGTIQ